MESESPAHMYPIKFQHVTWRSLEGESVLLNLETGIHFTLNETGTAVWELFDGTTSLSEIEQILCRRFDVGLIVASSVIERRACLMNVTSATTCLPAVAASSGCAWVIVTATNDSGKEERHEGSPGSERP